MKDKEVHLASLIVVMIFAWYYFVFRGLPLSIGFINAVAAFSAVILIGVSFILGPIATIFPKLPSRLLDDRRPFGLWGYALAALHAFLVPLVLLEEKNTIFLADAASIGFAAIAFMVFTLMALTSTNHWQDTLGHANWKSLQRTGYLALAFVLMHIVLLEQGAFLSRLTGQVAIGFILIVLLFRGLVLALRLPSRENSKTPKKSNGLNSFPH